MDIKLKAKLKAFFRLDNTAGTMYHNQLSNRDLDNQHPISAITNLGTTLDSKFNKDNIVQTTGQNTDKIMSQKSVTDELDSKITSPTTAGTNGQVLTSDGLGGQSWTTIQQGVEGVITPEEYGAVGDGTTNDYTALQNCFNAAKTNHKKVFLSKTYATNTVLIASDIEIEGIPSNVNSNEYDYYTKGSCLCATSDASNLDAILVILDKCVLSNFTIKGNMSNPSKNKVGLSLEGNLNRVNNVQILFFEYGLYCDGNCSHKNPQVIGCSYNIFNELIILDCYQSVFFCHKHIDGFSYPSGWANTNTFNDCMFRQDNTFKNTHKTECANKFAVYLNQNDENGTTGGMNQNEFMNCSIEGCYNGFYVDAITCLFTNNRTEDNVISYLFKHNYQSNTLIAPYPNYKYITSGIQNLITSIPALPRPSKDYLYVTYKVPQVQTPTTYADYKYYVCVDTTNKNINVSNTLADYVWLDTTTNGVFIDYRTVQEPRENSTPIIKGYYYDSKFYSDSSHTIEITGVTTNQYLDISTNKRYNYNGTTYSELDTSTSTIVTGYYYNSKFYSDSSHETEITGDTSKNYFDISTFAWYKYTTSGYVYNNLVTFCNQARVFGTNGYPTTVDGLRIYDQSDNVSGISYKGYEDGLWINLKGQDVLKLKQRTNDFNGRGLENFYLQNSKVDTRPATLNYPGAMTFDTSDKHLYYKDDVVTTTAWKKLLSENDISNKWDNTTHPTTISGYGITDANINDGTITLGENTITPLNSEDVIQATLISIDNAPTLGSANLVTSNGVYTEIAKKQNKVNILKDTTAGTITLTPLSNYYYVFTTLTALNLSFTNEANDGDEFHIMFQSGSTATTLTISTTYSAFDTFTPSANKYIEIEGKWYIDKWILHFNEVSVPTT